jgi:flagellar operon protein (TIGR03826 family)
MSLANCPRCGRLFSRQLRNICPQCQEGIEKEYEVCVAYLKENKNCTQHQLSEATGVTTRQITQFIREGRLSMEGMPNMSYPCESCGQPIREGQICESCRAKLQKDMRNALTRPSALESNPAQDNRTGNAYQINNRLKDRL